jgi:hypothetical protein
VKSLSNKPDIFTKAFHVKNAAFNWRAVFPGEYKLVSSMGRELNAQCAYPSSHFCCEHEPGLEPGFVNLAVFLHSNFRIAQHGNLNILPRRWIWSHACNWCPLASIPEVNFREGSELCRENQFKDELCSGRESHIAS